MEIYANVFFQLIYSTLDVILVIYLFLQVALMYGLSSIFLSLFVFYILPGGGMLEQTILPVSICILPLLNLCTSLGDKYKGDYNLWIWIELMLALGVSVILYWCMISTLSFHHLVWNNHCRVVLTVSCVCTPRAERNFALFIAMRYELTFACRPDQVVSKLNFKTMKSKSIY